MLIMDILGQSVLPTQVLAHRVGVHEIVFLDKIRTWGSPLTLTCCNETIHNQNLSKTAYCELKCICRYITEGATKQLVTSCVLPRLDCCNFLLMGIPNSVIQLMQKVQNTVAHLILRGPHYQNCTSLWQQLPIYWTNQIQIFLHVSQVYNTTTGSAPLISLNYYCTFTALIIAALSSLL